MQPERSKLAPMQELIWDLNMLRSKILTYVLAELREVSDACEEMAEPYRVQSLRRVESPVEMLPQ